MIFVAIIAFIAGTIGGIVIFTPVIQGIMITTSSIGTLVVAEDDIYMDFVKDPRLLQKGYGYIKVKIAK